MEETQFWYEYRDLMRSVSIHKKVSWCNSIGRRTHFVNLGTFSLNEVLLLRDLLNNILKDNRVTNKTKED